MKPVVLVPYLVYSTYIQYTVYIVNVHMLTLFKLWATITTTLFFLYNKCYFLDTDFAEIRIFQENFPENKIYIRYTDLKNNQKHDGWISIDDLAKYATVPMMFEVRSQIRKIIKDIF